MSHLSGCCVSNELIYLVVNVGFQFTNQKVTINMFHCQSMICCVRSLNVADLILKQTLSANVSSAGFQTRWLTKTSTRMLVCKQSGRNIPKRSNHISVVDLST